MINFLHVVKMDIIEIHVEQFRTIDGITGWNEKIYYYIFLKLRTATLQK